MSPSEPAADDSSPSDHGSNESEAPEVPRPTSLLLSYLRLGRIPNVFTAMADITMGFYFTHPRLDPWPAWLWLIGSSSFLYTAGMVLNDVFDVEIDRRERPQRPLPSGQIAVGWARVLGFALLAIGVACGALAGGVPESDAAVAGRPSVIAIALAAAVLLYDGGLKKTLFGPLGMGLCRFLNVLLGMSLASSATGPSFAAYYEPAQLLAAAGIGLYIVGVTWFARSEAENSSRAALSLALAVMAGGIALLALFPEQLPPKALLFRSEHLWPALLLLLFAPLVRGALFAISDPRPERVQGVIRHAIMSLILFDAAIVMALRGAYPALLVLALLIPMKLLGRWVYST